MKRAPRILAVDDHLSMRHLYYSSLHGSYQLDIASNGLEAVKKVREHTYDVYFVDLIMPQISGLQLMRKIRKIDENARIVVVSQTDEIDHAVEAFRENAVDFLRKPVTKQLLIHAVERNIRIRNLENRVAILQQETSRDRSCPSPVMGRSPEMRRFWEQVKRVAESSMVSTILLAGETGTGKEVVARQIHSSSHTVSGPFIAVNCALLKGDLAASEHWVSQTELLLVFMHVLVSVWQRMGAHFSWMKWRNYHTKFNLSFSVCCRKGW